jgi:hypothetical protein
MIPKDQRRERLRDEGRIGCIFDGFCGCLVPILGPRHTPGGVAMPYERTDTMSENDVLRERLEKIAELAGRRVRIDGVERELAESRAESERYRRLVNSVLRNLHRVAVCGDTRSHCRSYVVSEVFGLGSVSAAKLCEEFGLEPDESIGGFDD